MLNSDILSIVYDYKRQLELREYWFVRKKYSVALVVKLLHPDELGQYPEYAYIIDGEHQSIYVQDDQLWHFLGLDNAAADLFESIRRHRQT